MSSSRLTSALLIAVAATSSACLFPIDIGSFGLPGGQALEGDPCSADADCADGLGCVDGACAAGSAQCEADADCGAGRVCTDGACERAPCASDADCAGGFCDRDGLCTGPDDAAGPIILISETGQGMGEVAIGGASIGDTAIENIGDTELVVDEAHFEGDGADQFFIATDVVDNGDGTATVNDMAPTLTAPFVIAPRETRTLFEVFQPSRLGDFTVELVVHSNDADTPQLRVGLRGVAVEESTRP